MGTRITLNIFRILKLPTVVNLMRGRLFLKKEFSTKIIWKKKTRQMAELFHSALTPIRTNGYHDLDLTQKVTTTFLQMKILNIPENLPKMNL